MEFAPYTPHSDYHIKDTFNIHLKNGPIEIHGKREDDTNEVDDL